MAHSRDIGKPLPEKLWIVWSFGRDVGLDAEMVPQNGSYRIYWSQTHAQNHIDRETANGIHTKFFEYDRGEQKGQV